MSYKVSVIIEKDDYGYYAYAPELPGCQSQGDSFDEIKVNIQEAIELYLETLSDSEKRSLLSQEIMMMTMEVSVA
jgi:predicted RNase H-like HicB family nuclease